MNKEEIEKQFLEAQRRHKELKTLYGRITVELIYQHFIFCFKCATVISFIVLLSWIGSQFYYESLDTMGWINDNEGWAKLWILGFIINGTLAFHVFRIGIIGTMGRIEWLNLDKREIGYAYKEAIDTFEKLYPIVSKKPTKEVEL